MATAPSPYRVLQRRLILRDSLVFLALLSLLAEGYLGVGFISGRVAGGESRRENCCGKDETGFDEIMIL